jgi:O-antigen/teichoic acid export membrane protein
LLTRAAYAEIARAKVVSEATEFRKLALQTGKIAGISGVLIVTLAIFAGEDLVVLLGGEAFRVTHIILVPLVIAASLELAGVAFEPVLHSVDRARWALFSRLAGAGVLVIVVVALIGPHEAKGAAWGVVVNAVVTYVMLGLAARHVLHQIANSARLA